MRIRCKISSPKDHETYRNLVQFCSSYHLRINRSENMDNTTTIVIEPLEYPNPLEINEMAEAYNLLQNYLTGKKYGVI